MRLGEGKSMGRCRIPLSISKGFTLVEVLVTVVIFSVGLLGLAGLQATGIKYNHSSLLRSQATLLAYDITDSMRANRSNVADYGLAQSAGPYSSPTTVVQEDINQWLTKLSQALPSGDGAVTINGNRVTVEIWWDDTRNSSLPLATMSVTSEI